MQQDIEHIRMRFFYLIKQDYAVWLSPDCFCQLSAFIISHVSRRRPYKSGYRMLLHIFGHVDTHHVFLRVKQCFGKRLCQLCLSYTRRSQEYEGSDRSLLILKSGSCSEHRFSDGLYSVLLTDNSPVQYFRQLEELFSFTLDQLAYRYASPA